MQRMKRHIYTKTWWEVRVYQGRMFQVEGGPPKSPKTGVCPKRWRQEQAARVAGLGMNEQAGGGARPGGTLKATGGALGFPCRQARALNRVLHICLP